MALSLIDTSERITIKDSELGVPDGDPGTTYTLRPLTTDDHRQIVRRNTTSQINKRTHQQEKVTDWDAVADDLLDHVLVGWEGIVYKGEPVPCERAYKLLLDAARKSAILDKAGLNRKVEEEAARQHSFRSAS